MIQVIDNFLPKKHLSEMMSYIPKQIPWEYEDFSVYEADDIPQLVHVFYNEYQPQSEFFDDILPVIHTIDDLYSIVRVKVNGTLKGCTLKEKPYHIDVIDNDTKEGQSFPAPSLKICILMLNDNNGYTQIRDDHGRIKRVQSQANRAILFPNTYEHMGTNCTDQNLRMTLNIVYA
jgi:hypothetical protein